MKRKVILIAIIMLGAIFRFCDINWDQNQHLHPDERFLTMVGSAMKIPPTFLDYFNPHTSPFNPANIGYTFYVYGMFPVILNKILTIITLNDNYNGFTLLGRALSGFVDLIVVIMVFKTAELFEKQYKIHPHIKYWSAFFYAIAVLPIQLSHFFAVDTFVSSFVFISFYAGLRFSFTKHIHWLLISALFFGLALASKVTAIFLSPLLLYLFINAYAHKRRIPQKDILKIIRDLAIFGIASYIIVRIADPYLFQNASFFDPRPSQLYLDNLKQLQALSNPQGWYPPGVQWIHKTPVLFGLKNLTIYGIGIGFTICVAFGIYYLIKKIKNIELSIFFIWAFLFFLYQSLQPVQTMRYFLMIYPFLALLAGIGLTHVGRETNNYIKGALIVLVVMWPVMFFSIYTRPVTRVSASLWIYENIPQNSIILTESWDDALPLHIDGGPVNAYKINELPVFDPDTPQKWQKMHSFLNQGDYLILSSNRGWGSIPTVEERYPQMTKYYQDLFAGKTNYKKVAEFTSYPSLSYLGIPLTISDDNAEEAFTVYDHPKVMIFKHIR